MSNLQYHVADNQRNAQHVVWVALTTKPILLDWQSYKQLAMPSNFNPLSQLRRLKNTARTNFIGKE
jgi:hypothetical protein